MEIPIKMNDLGVPLFFGNTHMFNLKTKHCPEIRPKFDPRIPGDLRHGVPRAIVCWPSGKLRQVQWRAVMVRFIEFGVRFVHDAKMSA